LIKNQLKAQHIDIMSFYIKHTDSLYSKKHISLITFNNQKHHERKTAHKPDQSR
jgi:hypothetical protein